MFSSFRFKNLYKFKFNTKSNLEKYNCPSELNRFLNKNKEVFDGIGTFPNVMKIKLTERKFHLLTLHGEYQ